MHQVSTLIAGAVAVLVNAGVVLPLGLVSLTHIPYPLALLIAVLAVVLLGLVAGALPAQRVITPDARNAIAQAMQKRQR